MDIPQEELAKRVELSDDLCVVDDEHYFTAARLSLPILGTDDALDFICWVSLSRQSYDRMTASWLDPDRVNEEPYFGWFSSRLPGYPDTLNLKVKLHQQAPGIRPMIELEPTEHPLSLDLHNGISPERAKKVRDVLAHWAD